MWLRWLLNSSRRSSSSPSRSSRSKRQGRHQLPALRYGWGHVAAKGKEHVGQVGQVSQRHCEHLLLASSHRQLLRCLAHRTLRFEAGGPHAYFTSLHQPQPQLRGRRSTACAVTHVLL